jgi:hypothetical protein
MEGGEKFVLLCYVPDKAKVKEKMVLEVTSSAS